MKNRLPRVGFLGLGWIGRCRLEALQASERVSVSALCDPDLAACQKASEIAPGAPVIETYEELLELDLDGVVIATPSALHAAQCIAAFERGLAVFCQKPLARTAAETRMVLEHARARDRLLAVDFCYRHTRALERAREVVRSSAIGTPFAAELVFHNAYGPNQAWAEDPLLAGGGCLMDLGVHLVDALLWLLDFPAVRTGTLRLFRQGDPLGSRTASVEDYATGVFSLESGLSATIGCSFRSSFGDAAEIGVRIFATRGGVCFENVGGSFYDFRCESYSGTSKTTLVEPPDSWGGRAITAWAEELQLSPRHRPTTELQAVSDAIDLLYGRHPDEGRLAGRAARSEAAGSP